MNEKFDQNTLRKIAIRKESIPRLLVNSGEGILQRRDPGRSRFIDRFIMPVLAPRIKLAGIEHWKEAIKFSEKGYRIVGIGSHATDPDTLAIASGLIRSGLGFYLDRLVFYGGLNMDERPQTRPFLSAVNMIRIATPEDLDKFEKISRNPEMPEEVRQDATNVLVLSADLNRAAKGITSEWTKSGGDKFFYPGAGRSKLPHGALHRAPELVGAQIPREGFILPVAITGLAEIYPPGKFPRLHRLAWAHMAGKSVEIFTGELIEAGNIWAVPKDDLRALNANRADLLNALIAELLPDGLVGPPGPGFYRSLRSLLPVKSELYA